MKRSLLTLTIISAFLALYLIGCGGGDGVSTITPNMQSSEGTLEITVPWPEVGADLSASLIQPTVAKITADLKTSTDPNATIVKSITIDKNVKTGTMTGVSTGDYYLDLKGLDSTDTAISRRIKKIKVNAGTNTVTGTLGVQIMNGLLAPSKIVVSPGDTLFWGNLDDKSYVVRFNVNGQPVRLDISPKSGLESAESVSYKLPDSLVSITKMELYEGTSGTGSPINSIDFSVELTGGQAYTNTGIWGITGAYDANYGTTFVAADRDANFYVAVYDPYSVANVPATDNINYAQYYVNHIEKYDSSGKHLTSINGGFQINTAGVVQIAGLTVDPEGRYIYITDANYDIGDGVAKGAINTGSGGRVLRFDARTGGTWIDIGMPLQALGYAPVNLAARTGGFVFGELNGLCVSSDGNFLYVAEYYPRVLTGDATPRYYLHKCDLTNFLTPVWDESAVGVSGGWPVRLNFTKATEPTFQLMLPVGTAISTNNQIYVAGHHDSVLGNGETNYKADTDQRILLFAADGKKVTRVYPPAAATVDSYPVMNYITGIAAYNVQSTGQPLDTAVFAMDWDQTPNDESGDLYKYNGGTWSLFVYNRFVIPVPVDGVAGQAAAHPVIAETVPAGQTGYGGALNQGYNPYGLGAGVRTGVAQGMTIAVCPNQTQEIYAGDSYHRVWKFSKEGQETDRWRLLYKEYANPAGVATDANNNVYVVDNVNCRVIKSKSNNGAYAMDYITQWGTPPFAAVEDNRDLMNWFDADRESKLLGCNAPDTTGPTADDLADGTTINNGVFYPTQTRALPNTASLAEAEFYYPWGVAVDKDKNVVYVVDWAQNPSTGTANTIGHTHSVGRIQKFQSPSTVTPGVMASRVTGIGVEWFRSTQHYFWYPTGVSYGKAYVWVANTFYRDGIPPQIPRYGSGFAEKFKEDGTSLIGMEGAENEPLLHPFGLATDATNNHVYVSDTERSRVLMYDLETSAFQQRVSTAGVVGGKGKGEFYYPVGCGLDSKMDLYVVDGHNRRMQKNLLSGGGWIDAWDENNLTSALYTAVDNNGIVYTTDNHRVKLYQASK